MQMKVIINKSDEPLDDIVHKVVVLNHQAVESIVGGVVPGCHPIEARPQNNYEEKKIARFNNVAKGLVKCDEYVGRILHDFASALGQCASDPAVVKIVDAFPNDSSKIKLEIPQTDLVVTVNENSIDTLLNGLAGKSFKAIFLFQI